LDTEQDAATLRHILIQRLNAEPWRLCSYKQHSALIFNKTELTDATIYVGVRICPRALERQTILNPYIMLLAAPNPVAVYNLLIMIIEQPGPSGLVARRSLAALEDPSSIPDAG